MAEVIRALPANADLMEIWVYLAARSIETVNSTIQAIGRKCQDCAEMPGIGRRRDDLAPGLRSISHGNYLIFYRPIDNGIEVVRVLHGSRDLPSQFDEN